MSTNNNKKERMLAARLMEEIKFYKHLTDSPLMCAFKVKSIGIYLEDATEPNAYFPVDSGFDGNKLFHAVQERGRNCIKEVSFVLVCHDVYQIRDVRYQFMYCVKFLPHSTSHASSSSSSSSRRSSIQLIPGEQIHYEYMCPGDLKRRQHRHAPVMPLPMPSLHAAKHHNLQKLIGLFANRIGIGNTLCDRVELLLSVCCCHS